MNAVAGGDTLRALSRAVCCAVALVTSAPAAAEVPAPQTLHAAQTPQPAPDFELVDLDGALHRLSDYRGKVVVLNFWATWCPPCRYEMPSMQRGWERVRDEDIVFLGVNIGEDTDTVFTFLADYPVEFPLLFDEKAAVIEAYPVTGLPTTYIIDPAGRITHRAVGSREWDDAGLLAELRALRRAP